MRANRTLFLPWAGTLACFLFSFAPATRAESAMQTYVSAMQPGWNLGNTLDAIPDETSWGNPLVTQAFIQQIAAQGFKSIRVTVTWTHHTGPAPDYRVDAAWMDRVQQIVDWSLDAGLYVMVNLHHDSWEWISAMPTNHDAVLAKFRALWTQIAGRFRDYPNELMFESVNEPAFDKVDDATAHSLLAELNTAFFHIVRDSGGNNAVRPLVLPSLSTNAGQAHLDALNRTIAALNDPNLIVTIHYYGFWPFSVNNSGNTTFDATSINDVVTAFDAVHATFVAKGIPAIVGEYGLLGYDDKTSSIEHGEMLKYFEYVTQYAQAKGLTHMVWDAGQDFDRRTWQWHDPDLYDIITHSMTGRSSTSDTDLIFLPSGAPVRDAVVNLNLNGNHLTSIADGSRTLTAGTDYTLDGSALTIKASTLGAYIGTANGETATLAASFDAGPAWKIHVRSFATPVLSAASGTKSGGLLIPTAFNGDLLATMEARYGDSGYPYPGPLNWTSYQGFNDSFAPNYANRTMAITPKFFAETTGAPITLTFHFWSGRLAKYQLTFSGANVQGSPVAALAPTPPISRAVTANASATFTVPTTGQIQWLRNGAALSGGATSTLTLPHVQPADTGIYSAAVSDNGATTLLSAILGVASTAKVIGSGTELQPADIIHPNGHVFDQVLLTGAAETITADPGQTTRTSFIDLNDDIVQVEFSGAGSLSVVLDDPTGPARPVNYEQDVDYIKGHAGIVIVGANETTNVSVFSVGRATANDNTGHYNILQSPTTPGAGGANDPMTNGSPLFVGHEATHYDGIADIAFIAIQSTNGKFGGVRTANASYFAHRGLTGLYAPGVQFSGPVYVGNIEAFDGAIPVIQLGAASDARITGGDMYQDNRAAVQVSGLTQLKFTAGSDAGGNILPEKVNQAVFEQNGTDVTASIVTR